MTNHIHVTDVGEAWSKIDELFPFDYIKDESKSARAGYDIFTSATVDYPGYIADLGRRFELVDENGDSTMIWVDEPTVEEAVERLQKSLAAAKKVIDYFVERIGVEPNTDIYHLDVDGGTGFPC